MSRINIHQGPLEVTVTAAEKVQELCNLFPDFKGIGTNSLGVTFVEWRVAPMGMMDIKEEILNILNLPLTKDVKIHKILKEDLEVSEDVMSLDTIDIDTVVGSDRVMLAMNYDQHENDLSNEAR